jgi:hypothetical protein
MFFCIPPENLAGLRWNDAPPLAPCTKFHVFKPNSKTFRSPIKKNHILLGVPLHHI